MSPFFSAWIFKRAKFQKRHFGSLVYGVKTFLMLSCPDLIARWFPRSPRATQGKTKNRNFEGFSRKLRRSLGVKQISPVIGDVRRASRWCCAVPLVDELTLLQFLTRFLWHGCIAFLLAWVITRVAELEVKYPTSTPTFPKNPTP